MTDSLFPTGEYLGTHGAQVHTDAQGHRWLVKPQEAFMNHLDAGTAAISQLAGLTTPDTQVVDLGRGQGASAQRMLESSPAFRGSFNVARLSPQDRMALQKSNVLDWMLSNHDAHPGQFIRTTDGQLVGIDKGQSFRYMGRDKLDPAFHPNAYYGEREPVYNTMWRHYAQGRGEMDDPRTGELGQFLTRLQSIPDETVRTTLRPYAQAAAQTGKLMGTGGSQPGLTRQTIPANDPEAFLDAVVSRKNSLADDFGALYDRTTAQRNAPHVAAVLREAGITEAGMGDRITTAMPTYYHHTREPDFKVDFDRKPGNEVLDRKLPYDGKGLWVSPDKDAWSDYQYRGRRPYVVQLHSDEDLGGDGSELFVGGDQLRNMEVRGIERKSGLSPREARTEQVGVSGRLPTSEVAKYFHSVITPEDLDPDFDADVRTNGVQTPIEISTDGIRAAITEGHHRILSAQGAGLRDVPVQIYRTGPLEQGRGGVIGEHLNRILQGYPQAIYRDAGIKTAMPPRSIDTEVSLMPASEFEEDLVEPPKKTKREPQPVQGELFDQPQKVSPSAEFEEDDPPFYSPNFPTPRGKQMALPQKTMREFGNPAIQGDTYRLTSFLDPEAMTQSVIDKYNDSSPEVREWGGDWYDAGREYIDHLAWITGRPPEQVAAVMAAFSPRTDWNSNMGYATHFLLNYPTEKIDPNDPLKRDPVAVAALKNSMGSLGENFDRAARVVDADPSQIVGLLNKGEEAQKVRNFYRNFMGHTNDVTIDAWMARALMGHGHDRDNGYMADKSTGERSLGLTGAYDVMSGAVQEAARRLQAQGVHITPRELQAIVWTHVNPTANYGDWTPEKIRAKIKRLQTSPPDKPLPDYTKGPGYQYLPEPSYQNRRNAAFEEDDAGHWSGGEFPPAGPNSTWYHASPYELAPRTLFHRGQGWVPMDGVRGRKVTAMHGYTNKPLPAPPTTYDIQPDNGARIIRSEESGLEYDVVARPNGRGDGYDVVKQLPTTNGKRPRTAASDFEDTDDRYSLPTLWEDYQNWGGGDSPDSVQFWGNVEEYLKDRHGLEPWPANGEDVQEYLDHYFAHPATMGMAKLHSLAQGRSQVDGYTPLTDDDLTQGAALGLLKIRRNQKTRRLEPIAERTAIKIAMPVLYRGLEHEFDPDVDANDTLPPAGYSHWTNSPALARQYAGPEGHVYFCDFPDEAEGESYIDEQGERPLYYNNGGLVGLRGVKGDEYLVYHGHPDYDPGKIKDVRDARVGATHHMYDDIFNPYTEEDTQNMVWDWDKGRFRPRRPDEDRMIPPMPGRTAEAGLLDERDAGLNTAMSVVPEDYRGQHQAPDTDYGASMDNPDMMFPDIATHPEYYDTYQPFDYQSHSAISRSRGRPDRKVDIYRALPMSALVKNGREHFFPLNAGDWVTPSYDYAKQHGEATLDQRGPWTILHTKAPAGQLYSEGNSIHEWAYQGDNKMTVEHPRARQQRYRRTKRGPVE